MTALRILLVQLFSNGDCLYATAVARQIKQDFENCHLTWAISPSCRSMIDNNPYVDEVMEITTVPKNSEAAFNRFIKDLKARKKKGEWDKIIVTHIMGANQANYDGCIRSAVFRGYRFPLTVAIQPILRLREDEFRSIRSFVTEHRLVEYRHVILFEFAPLSGQSLITREQAIDMAQQLAASGNVAVILSSAQRIAHANPAIIDGSTLTMRETAGLTHHCSLLLGCSSGLTWLSTADCANLLPMVQLLNPDTPWLNSVARDFKRFGLNASGVIELHENAAAKKMECIQLAMIDFEGARKKYHRDIPMNFHTSTDIVYNLLCYFRFGAIVKHVRINRQVHGIRPDLYLNVLNGFLVLIPRLISNLFRKRILRSS